jgi:hypothetical protein
MTTRRKTKTVVKKEKNHVVFIIDESGSMGGLESAVVSTFNKWKSKIKEENSKYNQETTVSLIKFNNQSNISFFNASIDTLEDWNSSNYRPNGGTALFGGIDLAIRSINGLNQKDVSNLLVIITDGYENSSGDLVRTVPPEMMKLQKEGNWSFVVLVPPGNKQSFVRTYNLLSDNVEEWTATAQGLREVEVKTSGGLSNYYSSRSRGLTQVNNFFKPIDLSGLKTRDLDNKLDEVTDDCLALQVDKEEQIRDFVERKTKLPYRAGSAHYQLSKREKVQNNKSLLILDKKTGTIYGGRKARTLVGIPENVAGEVEPHNLTDKEIFIESRSTNRKLVRGTKVIVYPK